MLEELQLLLYCHHLVVANAQVFCNIIVKLLQAKSSVVIFPSSIKACISSAEIASSPGKKQPNGKTSKE